MELVAAQSQAGPMRLSALLTLVLWLASGSASAQTLVVHLYDYADLLAKETERLTQTVDLVFEHSGIQMIWQYCRGALAVGTACGTELQVTEVAVRLLPGGPRTSDDFRTLPLGTSIVGAEGGYYASVFVPAVRAQAGRFGVAFNLLLAYAIAHEVGHCLLGPGHSYAGLMRSSWNRKDAIEISRLSLRLTKEEARKASARLRSAILPSQGKVQAVSPLPYQFKCVRMAPDTRNRLSTAESAAHASASIARSSR